MTPFEYVSVLISIILGLGISQLATGVADMVHQLGACETLLATHALDRVHLLSAYSGLVDTL